MMSKQQGNPQSAGEAKKRMGSEFAVPHSAIVVATIHHGNTMKIAQAMSEALNADLLSATDIETGAFGAYDLVGFGSGIYFGRHHRSLRALVAAMNPVPDTAFIFSTAGLPFLHRLFHWPLRRLLAKRGCHVLGEFSCRGWDTVGPLWLFGGINRRHPDERDQDRARRFAEDVIQRRRASA